MRKPEVYVLCFLVNEWAGMEMPRLQDGRCVAIKRRVALTGDEGTMLGVVTGPGVDCVGREGRIDVGCEVRVGRGGCVGTC